MYTPKFPPNYVERPSELEEIIATLINHHEINITGLTAALRGAGGFGKSTLANAVCTDDRIKRAFPDGIFWVDLGEKVDFPSIAEKINHLLRDLGQHEADYTDYRDASKKLRDVLLNLQVLIVIDDVWNAAYLDPFRQGGGGCAYLVTTRDSNTLPPEAKIVFVDAVSSEQASLILRRGLPEGEDDLLNNLAEKLWKWPLLLSLANGQLCKDIVHNQVSLRSALEKAFMRYESKRLNAFDLKNPIERNQAVSLALDVSLEQMEAQDRELLLEIAVFPANTTIPLTAIKALWERTASIAKTEVEDICGQFASQSFLQFYDTQKGSFRIHAVIQEYLDKKLGDRRKKSHRDLVEGYLDEFNVDKWWLVPDDQYFYHHLIHHLLEADLHKRAVELLFEYMWLKAELKVGGAAAIRDCETVLGVVNDDDYYQIHLIRDFFRISAHILEKDPNQLPTQLVGRLFNFQGEHIRRLIQQVEKEHTYTWLKPKLPYFTAPGGSELMTLEGHTRSVIVVGVTNDNLIISGSEDGTLRVWDFKSGNCLHVLKGHSSPITALGLASEKRIIISGTDNGTVKIWDIETGDCLYTLEDVRDGISSIILTPDGRKAVWITKSGALIIWGVGEKNGTRTLDKIKGNRQIIKLGHNGKIFALVSDNLNLTIWDIEKERQLHCLTGHSKPINDITLATDGKMAVSVSSDHTLKVWDIVNGKCLKNLRSKTILTKVILTSDGKQAVSASDDYTLKIWDLVTEKYLFILKGHEQDIQTLALDADEKLIITASNDRSLKIWQIQSGECISTLKGHTNKITALALFRDRKWAISGSQDKTLKIWDIEAGINQSAFGEEQPETHLVERHTRPINSLTLIPGEEKVISVSQDNNLKIWDIESGKCLQTLEGHKKPVNAVAVTPDGKRAISGGGDGTLIIWDIESGLLLRTMIGKSSKRHEKEKEMRGSITGVAITPEGARAVSTSRDTSIFVWDMDNGTQLHQKRIRIMLPDNSAHSIKQVVPKGLGITALGLTPDGTKAIIAASHDCSLRIYNLHTGKFVFTLLGHTRFVSAIALTPDGKRVVSASYDTHLKVWDLEKGKCIHTLKGHTGPVRTVVIVPDGKKAVSTSTDHSIRVWDVETGFCIHTIIGHSDRVNAVALNDDGKWIVSAANDKTIKVWDINTGECLGSYYGDVPFYTVTFKPRSEIIIAGDHKGFVHILDIIPSSKNSTPLSSIETN